MHVYVYVGLGHMYVCMHVEAKDNFKCHSSGDNYLVFLRQGHLLAWSLPIILDRLVSRPPQHWDCRCVPPCSIFYVGVGD